MLLDGVHHGRSSVLLGLPQCFRELPTVEILLQLVTSIPIEASHCGDLMWIVLPCKVLQEGISLEGRVLDHCGNGLPQPVQMPSNFR